MLKIVVAAVVIALASLLLIRFQQARRIKAYNPCLSNLRALDSALSVWKTENPSRQKQLPGLGVLAPYLPNGVVPVCPNGGKYTLDSVSAEPRCSIGGPNHTIVH